MSSLGLAVALTRLRLPGTSVYSEPMSLPTPEALPHPFASAAFDYSTESYIDPRGYQRAKARFVVLDGADGAKIKVRAFCGAYKDGLCEADLSHHKWEEMKEAHPPTPPPRTSPVFVFDFVAPGAAALREALSEDEGVLDCGHLPPVREEDDLPVQFSLEPLPNEEAEFQFTHKV